MRLFVFDVYVVSLDILRKIVFNKRLWEIVGKLFVNLQKIRDTTRVVSLDLYEIICLMFPKCPCYNYTNE